MAKCNENDLILPPEIYNHIFSFLDGYSLLQIEKVCNEWKVIIEWLGKKSSIWQRACARDMPRKVLLTMLQKQACELKEKHEILFRNWISWQSVSNYETYILNSKTYIDTINNITCAKFSGKRIIYGTIQGTVNILSETFQLKETYEPRERTKVNDIHFMNNTNQTQIDDDDNGFKHSHLLVLYDYELKLFALNPKLRELTSLALSRPQITVCDHCICISNRNGYVEVFEVDFSVVGSDDDHELFLKPVINFRLYRPIIVECLNVFDKILTIVTKNKFFKLDYNTRGGPKWRVLTGHLLPFTDVSIHRYWTFYHEVVFAKGDTNLHVLSIENNQMHTFDWMQYLGAPICEIYYYGNILFITTQDGQVYIYVIKDWSTFHLMKYDFKINVNAEPLLTFDVQELKNEHRILVASNEVIYQIFLYL